ncbi:MAG: hypothetical protein ACLT1L_03090 [Leuconostoc lactis]|uniref:hypothetical protein n=1 Tax=Leuconostoc lactis TaxID=1246 RepID=UPI0039912B94
MKFQFTIDTLIALLALATSIYSIWRTNWLDKYSLEITSLESELSRGQILFSFSVINTSTRVLKIIDLKMYLNGQELTPLDLDIVQYDKKIFEMQEQSPYDFRQFIPPIDDRIYFEKPSVLLPGEKFNIRVYLNHDPNTIELTADHRIKGFKKTKSFSVDKFNLNNMDNV